MPKLSQDAVAMLHEAECSEIADDYIIIGNIGVTVLLSHRAVADLNRQARDRKEAGQFDATYAPKGDRNDSVHSSD